MNDAQETQCPNCGCRYELPYQGHDQQLLKVVEKLERDCGKATTRAIASRVYLSESQIFRLMSKLESRGEVLRVGTKGGWRKAA